MSLPSKKTVFLILLFLLPVIAQAAYATYRHSAFVVGDGKDINLNGQKVGNGTVSDLVCVVNCSNFNSTVDLTNLNASINPYAVNAVNLTGR